MIVSRITGPAPAPAPASAPLVALLAVACTTTPVEQYDPFVAPEEQVLTAIEAMVATPLTYPEDLHVSPGAAQLVDSIIEAELRTAGVTVVPAAEYGRIWDRILRQTGGFFDPITGERSEAKFQTARRELLRELRGRFGTEVVLFCEIQVVEAVVDDGVAKWDGASQRVTGSDNRIVAQFRGSFVSDAYGSDRYGTIGALSLVVSIDGAGGEEIYRNFGGVEVLSSAGLEDDPADYVLVAEEARLAHAVGIVLGPLSRKTEGISRR